MSQGFGVYVHIPYCLQRCTYCDFATYVQTEIKPPDYYVEKVKTEIFKRRNVFQPQPLTTLYFGGGTPSLIPAELIVDLISELNKFGYTTGPNTEITLEINPATVNEQKLNLYLKAGVNRFSVGAQTFSDRLLKMVHREHNSKQTLQTLELLRRYGLNFSFDILFALPTQTVEELKYDLDVAVELGSKHISPYCLTVPESHPLSKNRPLDEAQVEMFDLIDIKLKANGFNRYELSNYALSGYESKHNLLYWTDQEYWGLGLSAHSYSKKTRWGSRFWNVNNFDQYCREVDLIAESQTLDDWPENKVETLSKAQCLTDFCYTSLRLNQGLSVENLVQKFAPSTLGLIEKAAGSAIKSGHMRFENGHYSLTSTGFVISNQIFEKFAFFDDELN
jgi:oxygen-independent coproporphyrinogen-3 oxidase